MTFNDPELIFPTSLANDEPRKVSPRDALEAEVVQFFDELRTPMLRYVMAMGLRHDDSEEIVQEVFLALFRHLKLGRPRTNLKGWVFRVGHNLALKRRQRNVRRDRVECAAGVDNDHVDAQLDPEEELAEVQRRRRLCEAVENFPEIDRCCLYLRAEGLRYREIADVLGISLGGVSLALGRSISRLGALD